MKVLTIILMLAASFIIPVHAEEPEAYEPMEPFSKMAGKSWRGEGTGPNGQPIVDIATHEMILGGRAFQSIHRLENGVYGGKTVFFYDEGAEEYIFHYFTTAGFHTTGVIELTETGFKAIEKVQNHDVYDEVRSEVFIEDGQMRVVSSHVDKQGNSTEGEGLIYAEIDDPGPLY